MRILSLDSVDGKNLLVGIWICSHIFRDTGTFTKNVLHLAVGLSKLLPWGAHRRICLPFGLWVPVQRVELLRIAAEAGV